MKKERIIKTTACILTAAMAFGAYLPAGVMMTAPASVHAADGDYTQGEKGPLKYNKYADHAEIIGCSMDATSVEIPETIDGVPVTVIGMYAFSGAKFTSVVIPDSVKEIGNYAFNMNPSLESVTLGDGLEKIGIKAFELCTSLKKVTFPDHLVEMSTLVFDSTPWLEEQRKASDMVIVNGALIDGRSCKGDVVIPSDVTFVAAGAFQRNEDITSVVYNSKIKKVCDDTFFYCKNLKSADIRGVESVGIMAFDGTALKELKISDKLTAVGDYAFSDGPSSGTITFYGTKDAWEKVPKNEEFLKNATVVFEEASSEPEDDVLGDVNADGVFNTADFVLFHKWLLAVPDAELKSKKAADFNGDGSLNIADLIRMKGELMK